MSSYCSSVLLSHAFRIRVSSHDLLHPVRGKSRLDIQDCGQWTDNDRVLQISEVCRHDHVVCNAFDRQQAATEKYLFDIKFYPWIVDSQEQYFAIAGTGQVLCQAVSVRMSTRLTTNAAHHLSNAIWPRPSLLHLAMDQCRARERQPQQRCMD